MDQKIIKKIAKKHRVSVGEVKQDIKDAIDFAYTDPNPSFINVKAQNAVLRKNKIPTPDELISHVASKCIEYRQAEEKFIKEESEKINKH